MKLFHLSSKKRQSGEVAKLLLVLAAIVLVALAVTFFVVRGLQKPSAPAAPTKTTVPQPVYEQQLGNIKFVFEAARNAGGTLLAANAVNAQYTQKDLNSPDGSSFIFVTVGAENEGTVNTQQGSWTLGNIIDSQGRNFIPLDGYIGQAWIPANSQCGALLAPAFDPIPCTQIYEVSNKSTGLKIQVLTGQTNNSPNDLSAGKTLTYNLDMVVN
jgi:hypothetical protein